MASSAVCHLSGWLSAFALPGQLRGAVWEDPPFFASETSPLVGQSIKQSIGPLFRLNATYLGDQWSVGDWAGLQRAIPRTLPMSMLQGFAAMFPPIDGEQAPGVPQNLREYDPEWGKAFVSGIATASCDHAAMISQVKVPVLLTQHFHQVDEATGTLVGAMSDLQASRAAELVAGLARAEHQPDRFRAQAPRHQREGLRRGLVQPLDVVDDTQQGALRRDLRRSRIFAAIVSASTCSVG